MKLNLGSGFRKQNGFINIDNREECCPDIVCDISKGIPFENDSIEHVRAFDILEHIPILSTIPLIEEIYRVLCPKGIFEHYTPTCEFGVAAFVDPTHVNFWCKQRHLYFVEDAWRNLYGIKAKFEIIEIKDVCSNKDLNFYHTYARLMAVKK